MSDLTQHHVVRLNELCEKFARHEEWGWEKLTEQNTRLTTIEGTIKDLHHEVTNGLGVRIAKALKADRDREREEDRREREEERAKVALQLEITKEENRVMGAKKDRIMKLWFKVIAAIVALSGTAVALIVGLGG